MRICTVFLCLFIPFQLIAQRNVEYNVSLSGHVASKDNLPMWSSADKFGVIPNTNNITARASVVSDFNEQHKIQMAYGASFAGSFTSFNGSNRAIIDEIFISSKWKVLRLDAGIIHPDIEYNGISSTNGNILYSTNSRSLPGINLRTDYFSFPYIDKYIEFKGNLAAYRMTDDRVMMKTRVHHKSLFVKLKPWKRLELIVGADHYAQWGGYDPNGEKQPATFKDYLRIFMGKEGDARSSLASQLNVLGNHIGREHFKINFLADNFVISAYHDIVAEDRSGIKFRTVPDGLYGIYLGKNNKTGWLTDIIYEFYYTKYQAGPIHDRPATPEEMADQDPNNYFYGRTIIGGNDNYLNHGEYRSGWTFFGNPIGAPFFAPFIKREDKSMVLNNRFVAHYIGIKGKAFNNKLPYFFRASYSMNYGTYDEPLENKPKQFSIGLETRLPDIKNLPFNIEIGMYGDVGDLYKDNIGFSITFSKKGGGRL